MSEIERLRSFHDRVVAIASNERADHHSIGWAIVSLVDEDRRTMTDPEIIKKLQDIVTEFAHADLADSKLVADLRTRARLILWAESAAITDHVHAFDGGEEDDR